MEGLSVRSLRNDAEARDDHAASTAAARPNGGQGALTMDAGLEEAGRKVLEARAEITALFTQGADDRALLDAFELYQADLGAFGRELERVTGMNSAQLSALLDCRS